MNKDDIYKIMYSPNQDFFYLQEFYNRNKKMLINTKDLLIQCMKD